MARSDSERIDTDATGGRRPSSRRRGLGALAATVAVWTATGVALANESPAAPATTTATSTPASTTAAPTTALATTTAETTAPATAAAPTTTAEPTTTSTLLGAVALPTVMFAGNAVCDPDEGETTVTWRVTNAGEFPVEVIGETAGVQFDPTIVSPFRSRSATEVIEGPASDEVLDNTITVEDPSGATTDLTAGVTAAACEGPAALPEVTFTFFKTANMASAVVGQTVSYSYCGENTSGIPLEIVRLVDDRLGVLIERPNVATTVQPGDTLCNSDTGDVIEYVIQPNDAGTSVDNNCDDHRADARSRAAGLPGDRPSDRARAASGASDEPAGQGHDLSPLQQSEQPVQRAVGVEVLDLPQRAARRARLAHRAGVSQVFPIGATSSRHSATTRVSTGPPARRSSERLKIQRRPQPHRR